MTRAVEIATIILDQIKQGTTSNLGRTINGKHAMMCWAARNFNAVVESKEFAGGLEFQVDGHKYQGLVRVLLAWDDTYTIRLEGQEEHTYIFFDQLTELIDRYVETGEE